MRRKLTDFFVVTFLLFVATLYALYIPQNIIWGKSVICGFIYLAPSIIYLGLRAKKNWRKIFVFSLVFGALFGFIFEFIAQYNKAYAVISTLTPYKFLGVLPLDNIIGHFMMATMTFVFYEHFIEQKIGAKISKRINHAIFLGLGISILIIVLFLLHLLPHISYPYLVMGTLAILFPLSLAITQPRFIKNMSMMAIFFFFLYLLMEVVAVHNSWWIYPGGEYVGWVDFLGSHFPIEELLFWMLFYAATLISFYEYCMDISFSTKGK
jgi:hypothetical protein